MLKEWLDRNLRSMVERFVEREIVRLTRRPRHRYIGYGRTN